MTNEQFEGRIDRLTERHEALAQTVELIGHRLDTMGQRLDTIITAINQDAENIRALARIAEAHEHRLSRLEDGEG